MKLLILKQFISFWAVFVSDLRISSRGCPASRTTGRTTRTVCTSEGWMKWNLGYSMMITAPARGTSSARNVWYTWIFHSIYLVLCSNCILQVSLCPVSPQPRVRDLLHSPQHLDQVHFIPHLIITLEASSDNTWVFIWICAHIWIGVCCFLLQGGMRSAARGWPTRLTTTATCLTTCRWGRGRTLEPTAWTREEICWASRSPSSRASYTVWPLHLHMHSSWF